MSKLNLLLSTALCLFFFACEQDDRITFHVNTTSDFGDNSPGDDVCGMGGSCSLRAALEEAAFGDKKSITIILPTGRYRLDAGQLEINGKILHIRGQHIDHTIIDAQGRSRAILINSGLINITKLTIENGITNNNKGGGILVHSGAWLTLEDVLIQDCQSIFRGGGLCIDSDGLVTLNRVIVRNNETGKGGGGGGGGIYNRGKLTINNSLIEANIGGNIGGGIGHHGEQLTISNSAIVNNEGYRSGLSLGGRAVLKNVTISGNHESNDSFTATGGWGVTVFASVHMRNVTITDNGNTKVWMNLDDRGGGVLVTGQGRLTMQNSLVAENEVYDISGSITSNGFNLIGNASQLNVSAASGDQLGSATHPINPRLDDLSYNGGFTPTHALLPGSPAIDGGSNLAPISDPTSCLSKDQRGVSRPQDGDGRLPKVCDIGAFELES